MHGLAGSAALVVLTASILGDPADGLLFIVSFGLGSIIGMAALSAIIALPISLTARSLTRANSMMQGSIGTATVSIGIFVIAQTLPGLFGV